MSIQTVSTRHCEVAGCENPRKAHGLCQSHYDQQRGDGRNGGSHRHRFIEQAAKNRATQILRRTYRDEYRMLIATIRADLLEAARQRKTAAVEHHCTRRHDVCPICGSDISVSDVVGR